MNTASPWWDNEVWDRVSFTWDLWYGCNYRCSYCWWEMDDLWADLAKKHLILEPQKWIEAWDRVHAACGETRIDVLGGEPLRYPRWQELFAGLSEKHRVSITTNLSCSAAELAALTDRVSPERLHFAASWHPEFADWGDFTRKIDLLKEKGYEPGVLVVAAPQIFDGLAEWREYFMKRGVPFTASVFQGRWKGATYPDSYTSDQKAFLGMAIHTPEEQRYRLERSTTLGKPCGAGHVYANIKANGDLYRCGQDCLGGAKPFANLFDPELKLSDRPAPCPYEHCSCGEYAFLWEDWSRKKGRKQLAAAMTMQREARHA